MPLFDLPLSELESYAPEIPIPADLVPFWTDTLAETRGHDLALSRTPYDEQARPDRDRRPHLRRLRGHPGQGVAAPAGRSQRPAAHGRAVPRLLRWPRLPARHHHLGPGRLRPPGDGHPRPGLERGRAERHRRLGAGRGPEPHPRLHDVRDHRPAGLLLPPGLHRRRTPAGCRPRPAGGRPGQDHRHRRQPGWRHHHRGRRPCGALRHPAGRVGPRRAVPLPLPPRGRAHRPAAVRGDHPVPGCLARPRRAGVLDPGLLRRCRPRPAGDRADAVLGRPDGSDLPALDGVRGLPRVRRRRPGSRVGQGDPGLRPQRARGRRAVPDRCAARLVRRALRRRDA